MVDQFQYEDHEGMPQSHRQIARLRVAGLSAAEIATSLHMDKSGVIAALNHAPLQYYIRALESRAGALLLEVAQGFDEMLLNVVRRLGEVIEDVETRPRDILRAAEIVFDRHPSMSLPKQTRPQETRGHGMTAEQLQKIDELRRRMGLEPKQVEPADIQYPPEPTIAIEARDDEG